MGNILIGGENLTRQSSGLVPSSEAAEHPASNLKIPAPSEFWRITTLTGDPKVAVGFLTSREFNLVAPLYVTAPGHQNFLSDSNNATGADFTLLNLNFSKGTTPIVGEIVAWEIEATATAGLHHLEQSYTKPDEAVTITASFYVQRFNGLPQAELYMEGATSGDTAFAKVDLGDGSIDSSGVTGGFSGASATTTPEGSYHRITLTATTDAHTAVLIRFSILNNSFARSFSAAGFPNDETIAMGGVMAELGSTVGDWINSEPGDQAALWGVHIGTGGNTSPTATGVLNLALGRDLQTWRRELGWIHGFHFFDPIEITPNAGAGVTVFFYNASNAAGELDVSNLYIGKAFQPATNYKETLRRKWQEDTNANQKYSPVGEKMRRWELELHYLTKTEAEVTLDDILLVAGQSREILVILDPDDTTTGQQGCIYGKIVQHGVREVGFDGLLKQVRYAASMELLESVP